MFFFFEAIKFSNMIFPLTIDFSGGPLVKITPNGDVQIGIVSFTDGGLYMNSLLFVISFHIIP